MSAHDDEVVRQLVRGRDGRWTMADAPVTGSEDVERIPSNRSEPAPGRTSNSTLDTSPPDTSTPGTSPPDTGPLDTGPMVRRLLVRAGGTDHHHWHRHHSAHHQHHDHHDHHYEECRQQIQHWTRETSGFGGAQILG